MEQAHLYDDCSDALENYARCPQSGKAKSDPTRPAIFLSLLLPQERPRIVDMFGAKILAVVLPQCVVAGRGVTASIQVVLEQKTYCVQMRHLESFNLSTLVFNVEKLLYFRYSKKRTKPIPYSTILDEKPDIAI